MCALCNLSQWIYFMFWKRSPVCFHRFHFQFYFADWNLYIFFIGFNILFVVIFSNLVLTWYIRRFWLALPPGSKMPGWPPGLALEGCRFCAFYQDADKSNQCCMTVCQRLCWEAMLSHAVNTYKENSVATYMPQKRRVTFQFRMWQACESMFFPQCFPLPKFAKQYNINSSYHT